MPKKSPKPIAESKIEAMHDQEAELRGALLRGQFDLAKLGRFPVILLLSGEDRPGINAALNSLHDWLDARYLDLFAFGPEMPEEKGRPFFWRYWNHLPRRGRIGVYYHSYGINSLADRVSGRLDDKAWKQRLEDIRSFERRLTDDGALILKYWFPNVPETKRKGIEKRVAKVAGAMTLMSAKGDKLKPDQPLFEKARKQLLSETSTTSSTWTVLEQTETEERCLFITKDLRNHLTARLKSWREPVRGVPPRVVCFPGEAALPDTLGTLSQKVTRKDDLEDTLEKLQIRLQAAAEKACDRKRSSIIVFEGPDAAGKGGVIRRMTSAMDALHYRVFPIPKPTPEENQFHYLWRFWNKLPRPGHMAIFDRSWYGRVLVERVEGFATKDEWSRAYDEINDFERQVTAAGTVLLKFFLHIDADEQLGRFERRLANPLKKHKITEEDFRNRDKWRPHCQAANVMFARTSTPSAPWTVVPANSKKLARVMVLEKVVKALEENL